MTGQITALSAQGSAISITLAATGTTVAIPEWAKSSSLALAQVSGETHVSGSGDITWTPTHPASDAGTYTLDQSEEYSGALNINYTETTAPQAVRAGVVSRYSGAGASTTHYPGTEYRYSPALWQRDTSRTVQVTHEWYEDGVATGFTGLNYSREGAGPVSVRERIAVAGQAVRTVFSNEIVGEAATTKAEFNAPDGTALTDYADPSGFTWGAKSPSIPPKIYNGFARGTWGVNGPHFAFRNDPLGADQWAEGEIVLPDVLASISDIADADLRMMPGVRINTAVPAEGYAIGLSKVSSPTPGLIPGISKVISTASSGSTSLATGPVIPFSSLTPGQVLKVRIRAVGTQLTGFVDGVQAVQVTDATYATGNVGIRQWGAPHLGNTENRGFTSFDAGAA